MWTISKSKLSEVSYSIFVCDVWHLGVRDELHISQGAANIMA